MAKVGGVTVNFDAGTQQFLLDAGKVKTSLNEVGQAGTSAGKAANLAMKDLKNGITDNTRAAAAFATQVLGLGPVLAAAFPILAGASFGLMLVDLGKKVYDFFKQMQDAPEKARGTWGQLNSSVMMTNAELSLSIAQLQRDIDQLEGRHNNGLQVMLAEATAEAMKLHQELDKSIEAIYNTFKALEPGMMAKMFGAMSNSDLMKDLGGETGLGGDRIKMTDRMKQFNDDIANIDRNQTKEKIASQKKALEDAYEDDMKNIFNDFSYHIDKKKMEVLPLTQERPGTANFGPQPVPTILPPDENAIAETETLNAAQFQTQSTVAMINLNRTISSLRHEKEALTGAQKEQTKDFFADEMTKLNSQLLEAVEKFSVIGKSDSFTRQAKAGADAAKAIAEVNKQLAEQHKHNKFGPEKLTPNQEQEIRTTIKTTVNINAEEEWKKKVESTTVSINERIAAQQRLADAIDKGYEAVRNATVENQVASFAGSHVTDSEWMSDHQAELDAKRAEYKQEYDTQNSEQTNRTLQGIRDQIQLENALTDAHRIGAEAVRQVTQYYKDKKIGQDNSTDSAKKLIAAEDELAEAQERVHSTQIIEKLRQETAAAKDLAEATWKGAEAVRQAQLNSKYDQMRKTGTGDIDAQISTEKLKDQADHEAKIAEEAAAVVNQYSNQLEKLKEIEAAIKKRGDSTGKTVALETALKDIYKQQADILIKQNLATGTLQGGLNAFILECESKMKKPGEILYDGLNEAMDKSSDQLAKLFTGQKTDYKTMFKGIGENMMKETTKSLMQEGVGKLGEHFGIKIPGMEAKPDGSETKPFNVKIVGGFAGNSGGSTPFSGGQGIDGLFGGGDQGNGVFSMMQPFSGGQGIDGLMGGGSGQPTGLLSLLKAFSGGGIAGLFGGAGSGVAGATAGAGEMDELASMLGLAGMAEGGEVDPGQSYWVGDRADRMPEVFSPSVPGEITPIDKLGAGGDTHVTYNIDSRGSDIGSWSRVQQGLKATHDTSVVHSAQIQDAKKARVPERKGR